MIKATRRSKHILVEYNTVNLNKNGHIKGLCTTLFSRKEWYEIARIQKRKGQLIPDMAFNEYLIFFFLDSGISSLLSLNCQERKPKNKLTIKIK